MYGLDEIESKNIKAALKERDEKIRKNQASLQVDISKGTISRRLVFDAILNSIRDVLSEERTDVMLVSFPGGEGWRAKIYEKGLQSCGAILNSTASALTPEERFAIIRELTALEKHAESSRTKEAIRYLAHHIDHSDE